MNFKEAYLRLQEIHEMLQSDDFMDIEQIISLQEEAKKCYELCHDKLSQVSLEEWA